MELGAHAPTLRVILSKAKVPENSSLRHVSSKAKDRGRSPRLKFCLDLSESCWIKTYEISKVKHSDFRRIFTHSSHSSGLKYRTHGPNGDARFEYRGAMGAQLEAEVPEPTVPRAGSIPGP